MVKYRIVWFIRNSNLGVQFLWLLKIYFTIELKNIFKYFKSLIGKLTYDETIKILWIRYTATNPSPKFHNRITKSRLSIPPLPSNTAGHEAFRKLIGHVRFRRWPFDVENDFTVKNECISTDAHLKREMHFRTRGVKITPGNLSENG